jgi:hypothetical protein
MENIMERCCVSALVTLSHVCLCASYIQGRCTHLIGPIWVLATSLLGIQACSCTHMIEHFNPVFSLSLSLSLSLSISLSHTHTHTLSHIDTHTHTHTQRKHIPTQIHTQRERQREKGETEGASQRDSHTPLPGFCVKRPLVCAAAFG